MLFIVWLLETEVSNSNKEGKFEKINELLSRIQSDIGGKRESMASKFGEMEIWKDVDLWVSLFETLYTSAVHQQKKSEKKSRILNFVVGNVQKVIGSYEQDPHIENEVS